MIFFFFCATALKQNKYDCFKTSLRIEGRDMNGLGEKLFGEWSQQTLTVITLSE